MNIGTKRFTLLRGKQVGTDAAGNRYLSVPTAANGTLTCTH
jgi:hypothetical protein